MFILLVESPVFEGCEYRLANKLPGAPEVQPQRLQHHPEEPQILKLPNALQRTHVDGPQPPSRTS
jgi:hypothetical protein